MKSNKKDTLLSIISSYYNFKLEKETEDSIVIHVKDLESYPEDDFVKMVNRLDKIGFLAFTGSEGSGKIFIILKRTHSRSNMHIKTALALGSVASMIYTGYAYQSSFVSFSDFWTSLANGILFFFLPLGFIILLREAGRFLAHRINGMRYHIPILIPDPLGMGILGSIGTADDAYVSRRAMFYSGLFPLISGFLASLTVIFIGTYVNFPYSSLLAPVNSSFKSVSLPLIYSLVLSRISPTTVTLNIIQYAGWIGIVINALNAFPIGYLDGGLISKAVIGTYAKFASYGSMVGLFVLSVFYNPWFILLIFVILTGINGPEPLLSTSKITRAAKTFIVLALAVFILGISPIPYHVIPNDFTVNVVSRQVILVNNSTGNATFDIFLSNNGGSGVVPSFTMDPSLKFSVSGNGGSISPGGRAEYFISLPSSDFNTLGLHNLSLIVYSGISKSVIGLSVLYVKLSNNMAFNNAIPFYGHTSPGKPLLLNFSYTALKTENFSLLSFADDGFHYLVSINNITLTGEGFTKLLPNTFSFPPGKTVSIKVESMNLTRSWIVAVVSQNYYAALAYITVR